MKTLKKVPVIPAFVEECPDKEDMKFGEIYISKKYKGTSHLCLCGCGVECFLPLELNEWELKENNGKITISPSILQRFQCQSHYIINDNVANFV